MESSASEKQSTEERAQETEIEVSEQLEERKDHVNDTQPVERNSEVISDIVKVAQSNSVNVDSNADPSNTPQQIFQEAIERHDVLEDIPVLQKQASSETMVLTEVTRKENLDHDELAKAETNGSMERNRKSGKLEVDSPSLRPNSHNELEETKENPYFMTQALSDDEITSSSEMRRHSPTEDGSIDHKEYKYGKTETNALEDVALDDSESSRDSSGDSNQEEKQRIREQLIEQYRQAVIEHKIARETNLQLQTKLAEYFRRKKADAAEQQSGTSSVGGSTADATVDYEQRYNKYILSLTELRHQYQTMQNSYHKQIEELKNVCSQRQREVEEAYKEFTNYKYNIGKKALHSRTGRPINPKDLLAMLAAEQKKEAIVMEVRLENIKLRNEVAKVEAVLKSKEELAEGLHLIDFEQLKIENQTYNEKIEERNEELAKLKKKISSTVQIMTHVKEKLQAVQHDNAKQRQRLGIADAELTFNRDQLTKLKQARDHLRADNSRLRRSCGLLGKSALLFNYEDSVDAVNKKRAALEETKRITSVYRSRTKTLIEKIENTQERALNRQ